MKSDKKNIAKFMGYEVVRIGFLGSDATKWQLKNADWLDKPEIVEQYDNSVGDYFVNIGRNEIIRQEDVDYKNSWNDIMPVVEKIGTLKAEVQIATGQDRCLISYNDLTGDDDGWMGRIYIHNEHLKQKDVKLIDCVYTACLRYIKWYQSQPKPQPVVVVNRQS